MCDNAPLFSLEKTQKSKRCCFSDQVESGVNLCGQPLGGQLRTFPPVASFLFITELPIQSLVNDSSSKMTNTDGL